jgi:hypothetical protein
VSGVPGRFPWRAGRRFGYLRGVRTHTALAVAALALAGASCSSSTPSPAPADSCALLFGRPNAATGLTSEQCQPSCSCNGTTFAPPVYSQAFMSSLETDWVLSAPYPALTSDPYQGPAPTPDPAGTVCAVVPEGPATVLPRPYRLETFASEAAAGAAGASVTHFGHCGVCSTLPNLAVYMRNEDLTAPVRACGMANLGNHDGDVACLRQLGFDLPCAQIWAYNTNHTSGACSSTCLALYSAPYNTPDGGLNACLQCDETQSGPVFKSVAGRTRRNSGLPNAICRPCSEVQPLVHAY